MNKNCITREDRGLYIPTERGHATSTTIEIFSVTIFRTHSIGGIGMPACVQIGLTLKNFDVCTVTMALFSEGVYEPLALYLTSGQL